MFCVFTLKSHDNVTRVKTPWKTTILNCQKLVFFTTRHLKIDEQDYFGLLSATAQYDTIGAITVKAIVS